jgi:hypothetical protein
MPFRILLGIILIAVAIGLLLILVILPILPGSNDNPGVLNFFASILCESGERAEIEVVVSTDSEGTGYTPYTTCIGREGERTDASGKHLIIAIAAFTVPFLIGLFMIIFNARQARREVVDTWQTGQEMVRVMQDGIKTGTASASSFSTSGFFGTPQIEFKDGVLKVDGVEIPMQGMSADQIKVFQTTSPVMMGGTMQSSAGNLAAKLKEIQEARDAGLITSEEYERLRQEILDSLV